LSISAIVCKNGLVQIGTTITLLPISRGGCDHLFQSIPLHVPASFSVHPDNLFQFREQKHLLSVNQRRPLWCFGSGKCFFRRHSCRVETLIPVRSAASPKEIGASSGGAVGVCSPCLRLLLASNARSRYAGSSAYRFLRFSDSRSLFFAYQPRNGDSCFCRISATLDALRCCWIVFLNLGCTIAFMSGRHLG